MQAWVPGASPQTVPTEVGGRVSEVGAGLSLVEEEHGNSSMRKAKQLLNILFPTLPVHRSCEAVLQNWGVEKHAVWFSPGKGCLHSCMVRSVVFPKGKPLGGWLTLPQHRSCVLMFVYGFSLSNHCVLECASVVKDRGRHDRWATLPLSLSFLLLFLFYIVFCSAGGTRPLAHAREALLGCFHSAGGHMI